MGQGTGLGLSMVYGFARQSGGHVRIDSTAGQGTEVRLLLPRLIAEAVPPAAPAGDSDSDSALPAASRKGVVLVVDDEADIRCVMAEVLRLQGYTVLEAADAPEALRQLHETRPDMLVTDVGLPNGMNGRQLADQVRVQWPQMPVLLVTGYAESTVMRNETLPAQMELLTKPFAMMALAERVGAMLPGVSTVSAVSASAGAGAADEVPA
jgi:CheY-like chemotaxis protein